MLFKLKGSVDVNKSTLKVTIMNCEFFITIVIIKNISFYHHFIPVQNYTKQHGLLHLLPYFPHIHSFDKPLSSSDNPPPRMTLNRKSTNDASASKSDKERGSLFASLLDLSVARTKRREMKIARRERVLRILYRIYILPVRA